MSDENDPWTGPLVRLRAMVPDDAEVIHEHSSDGEVRLSASGNIQFPASVEAIRDWITTEAGKLVESDEPQLLIETLDGDLVGGIHPHDARPRHGTFSYGVTLFRPFWRRGYARGAITLVLRHYFEERRYQKCTVSAYDFNEASLQLHLHLGFREEGRLRRMIYAHGAYHDEVFLGLTAEEFARR